MSFIIYDIILLVLFAIFISVFLYTRKKNLKKEGLLFLYRTRWGIKLINYVGKKYTKTLKVLSYVSIGLGYCLMISVFYFFYTILKIYISRPDVVSAIKVPPIMPLIPYINKMVPGLPEFYFTYWIIILAIIAITHEFAHGIFAAYNKIKIKTTGFGFFPFFLPVFLAAFVELDETKMKTKRKISQMAILSAGTFANVLTAILFFIIMWLFFSLAFAPAGVVFDDYSYAFVAISGISSINNISLMNPDYEEIIPLIKNTTFNEIKTKDKNYIGVKGFSEDNEFIVLYDDAPAIKSELIGAITTINNEKITSIENLGIELDKYSPREKINIITKVNNEKREYEIVLGENPQKEDSAWLGIGFLSRESKGILGKVSEIVSSFKEPNVYYEPKFNGWSLFIYNLLWWIVLISISVALINMLPVGIFDGGRFFYLTILGITGSENKATKSFKFMTYFFLFLLLVLMILWAWSFI